MSRTLSIRGIKPILESSLKRKSTTYNEKTTMKQVEVQNVDLQIFLNN